jgi:integrase
MTGNGRKEGWQSSSWIFHHLVIPQSSISFPVTSLRGIVCQHVDDVKTEASQETLTASQTLLEMLKVWKQITQFSAPEDWIFPSPVQLGRLPWSYSWVWKVFLKAALEAEIGKLGTHTMRHSYRAWLDAVGAPLSVQQKLMRHADIRTMMNVYGDVITNEMAETQGKVAGLAVNSTQSHLNPLFWRETGGESGIRKRSLM